MVPQQGCPDRTHGTSPRPQGSLLQSTAKQTSSPSHSRWREFRTRQLPDAPGLLCGKVLVSEEIYQLQPGGHSRGGLAQLPCSIIQKTTGPAWLGITQCSRGGQTRVQDISDRWAPAQLPRLLSLLSISLDTISPVCSSSQPWGNQGNRGCTGDPRVCL